MCKTCDKASPKFKVKPFSGKRYHKNFEGAHSEATPCAICGKPVLDPWPHTAVVIRGGAEWGDHDSEQDGGHMGYWPIGSDCYRRHVIKKKG